MPVADLTVVRPARAVRGTVRVPGDKSISHRYALLAALADGTSSLAGFSPGADCASTLRCLARLGVRLERTTAERPGVDPDVRIEGRGLRGLLAPTAVLDAGNSGSTLRMLAGVLAAHPFTATLAGDESLNRRPMRRLILPLTAMGAHVEAAPGDRPPLTVRGAALRGITYAPEVPSAQIKSALLLAGLHAAGTTTVVEAAATRDHTERALPWFGAAVERDGLRVSIAGGQRLRPRACRVPGDLSSAAFWAVAAAGLPGSAVTIEPVGLNPSRLAFVNVLRRAGASVDVRVDDDWQGEPVGRLRVAHQTFADVEIAPAEVPALIDELPALAALATFGGSVRVTGAAELRVKESDRIAALVSGLRALGADADELADGFVVRATRRLAGGTVDAHGDHRLVMAFAVAALGASGATAIIGADAAAVSYPGFFSTLDALRA